VRCVVQRARQLSDIRGGPGALATASGLFSMAGTYNEPARRIGRGVVKIATHDRDFNILAAVLGSTQGRVTWQHITAECP
jgi:hypothetical protein